MSIIIINQHPNKSYIVRGLEIPSRFFLAPINTGFAKSGIPLSELLHFHTQRSGTEIGISYVGNVAIAPKYTTNENTLYFTENLSIWEKLTETILKKGSVPGIQLACRFSTLIPLKKWSNRHISNYIQTVQNELKSFSYQEIEEIAISFVESAKIAYSLGFKVLQIHAAHGYFLSQLISKVLNIRKDIFGEDKLYVIRMIVDKIRKSLPDAVIDIRISFLEGLEAQELEIDYKTKLIEKIIELDIDIISISNGIYDINKMLIYPSASLGHAPYLDILIPLASKYRNKLWNIAGNIWDIRKLPTQPDNITYSIGRSLIADPDFIKKSMNGQYNEINSCVRAGICHYYTRGKSHISCSVNKYFSTVETLIS